MSDVPFHLTRVGKRYYEVTLPKLVEQIERLNANLERIAEEFVDESGRVPSRDGDAEKLVR